MTTTDKETPLGVVWKALLDSEARGNGEDFLHLIPQHGESFAVDDTRAVVRTHFLAYDANQVVAYDRLAEQMAYSIVDYCIPRSKINAAKQEFAATGSTASILRLRRQAADLFIEADGTGEGGELLLYMLTEQILKYPQILAKMSLKTSSNMHYHGSDGIHAKFSEDGILDLFWGESKLYQDATSAFSDCFSSLAPFLTPQAENSSRQNDILLLSEHLDPGNVDLAAQLIKYFDNKNKESLELRWNGVCLIGFDIDNYPNIKILDDEALLKLQKVIASWQKSVAHRIDKHNLKSVVIEVFCIPFPSVEAMRKAVRAAILEH